MDGASDDELAYSTFLREPWPQIASTNPLDRLNGEIKRRADVIDIFLNDRSVVRLVGALMLEQCDEWVVSRRYMSLESLATLSDEPKALPRTGAPTPIVGSRPSSAIEGRDHTAASRPSGAASKGS